jgi:hypothetical protein
MNIVTSCGSKMKSVLTPVKRKQHQWRVRFCTVIYADGFSVVLEEEVWVNFEALL